MNDRRPLFAIALIMMIDIALLTGLLYLSGGPKNPFSFLYLVQIALATVLVRARWTWMLVGLAFLAVGVFVTWGLFAGPADLFGRAAANPDLARLLTLGGTSPAAAGSARAPPHSR